MVTTLACALLKVCWFLDWPSRVSDCDGPQYKLGYHKTPDVFGIGQPVLMRCWKYWGNIILLIFFGWNLISKHILWTKSLKNTSTKSKSFEILQDRHFLSVRGLENDLNERKRLTLKNVEFFSRHTIFRILGFWAAHFSLNYRDCTTAISTGWGLVLIKFPFYSSC